MSYCKFTEFTFPIKRSEILRQIEQAINAERNKAYDVYIKKTGSSLKQDKPRYDYGANNEYSIQLGTYDDHNYYGLCFADPKDRLRRHAYCFVWFKENSKYHCYFYHIYGVRPAEFAAYKASQKKSKSGSKVSTSVYSDGSVVMTQTYDDNGNVVSTTATPQQPAVEVNTDVDFMLQFGNLRAAFLDAIKDADAKTLQTGLVVKIVRLCKDKGKLLNDNEKKTCVTSLVEMGNAMRRANNDSFLDGMIQEAKNALSK